MEWIRLTIADSGESIAINPAYIAEVRVATQDQVKDYPQARAAVYCMPRGSNGFQETFMVRESFAQVIGIR